MIEQKKFIDFLLKEEVLQFGQFTLKSGRESPYFFNLGRVADGVSLAALGEAYAEAIMAAGLEFDVLFGPAYKGIPIAVATSIALASKGVEVAVAYNRKEAKAHGEGGWLVGAEVSGRVLLVDDVLTSGKAIREAVSLINGTKATLAGVVIAMDRQEVNAQGATAVDALAMELGASVISIAKMSDLIEYLGEDGSQAALLARMEAYQAQYCRM
ncbi:MAG: orotate phosphoribosyltransferase [Pseudomonadota bacterium]|nr:orotate phosphoribosyltransferase [Pseudomonadota bacterium]